jgi:hypothetical protein
MSVGNLMCKNKKRELTRGKLILMKLRPLKSLIHKNKSCMITYMSLRVEKLWSLKEN